MLEKFDIDSIKFKNILENTIKILRNFLKLFEILYKVQPFSRKICLINVFSLEELILICNSICRISSDNCRNWGHVPFYARYAPECTICTSTVYLLVISYTLKRGNNENANEQIGKLITLGKALLARMGIISLYQYVNVKTPFHLRSCYCRAIIHY